MVPDLNLLIGAALRAMREVVVPAIPLDQGVAAEQARMVIGVLSLLQQRVGFEDARSLKELEFAVEMTERVVPVLSHSGVLLVELEAARQGSDLGMNGKKRDAMRKSLLSCLAASIDNEDDAEAKQQLLRVVLDVSSKQTSFARAWSMPSGFEPASTDGDPLIVLTEAG